MDIFSFLRRHWGEIYTFVDMGQNITGLLNKKVTNSKDEAGVKSSAEPKKEKVEPLLGFAGLTRDNEQKFLRLYYKLDEGVQPYVAEGLLKYFVEPGDAGFISSTVASIVYDDFMLQVVNLDTASRSLGIKRTKKTETSHTTSEETKTNKAGTGGNTTSSTRSLKPSTRTETTTESEDEDFTPGGSESLKFLTQFGYVYQHGGLQAVDQLIQLFRLPTLDQKSLKKIDDFVKSIVPGIVRNNAKIRATAQTHIPIAIDKIDNWAINKDQEINERRAKLSWFGRLLEM
jgi:hypothetical protein